jgi:plastocyanin domain-containing protein
MQGYSNHPLFGRTLSVLSVSLAIIAASCKATPSGPEGIARADEPRVEGRRVDVTAGSHGYTPASIAAKKGESLVLRFTRTAKGDCMAQVVFPELKITKDLPLDTPVEIPIKADKPGKIEFQCGMAMVHGSVDVSG